MLHRGSKKKKRNPKRKHLKKSKEKPKIIGPPELTRFEKARIIEARTLQLSMGAPPLIEVPPNMTESIDIAKAELEAGVLPILIRRTLPNGTYQDIPLKRLIKKSLKSRTL